MGEEVVRYRLDDGAEVGFAVDALPGFVAASSESAIGRIRDAVEPALEAARIVIDKARALSPHQTEVKFGIKISGEAGWWIAKTSAEGSFEVTVTWKQPSAEE